MGCFSSRIQHQPFVLINTGSPNHPTAIGHTATKHPKPQLVPNPADENQATHRGLPRRDASGSLVLVLSADSPCCMEVCGMLETHGFRHQVIETGDSLWKAGPPRVPACLLCVHPLPNGITELELLEGIAQRSWLLPTVVISTNWTIPEVVHAMRAGADNCLTWPLESAAVIEAVAHALGEARARWIQAASMADAKKRLATLDKRELQVVRLVLRGMLNKEIADELQLALITVKVYRGRAMKKLGAGNAAELARITGLAGLGEDESPPAIPV